METLAAGAILEKTRELCETLVAQPEFKAIRERIQAFEADTAAQELYAELNERGSALQHKQQMGSMPDEQEIRDFEERRQAFLDHAVARGFLDAQHSIHEIRETVARHLTRTFELGRPPQPEDFHSCSCGHGGCGG